MSTVKSDTLRGLYKKFFVTRTDGSSAPGCKHENCSYFVVDLNHDPYAAAAIRAYSEAARKAYPKLAADLDSATSAIERRNKNEAQNPRGA